MLPTHRTFSEAEEAFLKECFLDTRAFAKYFWPETFTRDWCVLEDPELDDDDTFFECLDNDDYDIIAGMAPREYGKSARLKAKLAQWILFQPDDRSKFHLWVSETEGKAEIDLAGLIDFLETAPLVEEVFGPQQGPLWSRKRFVTKNGVMVMARGMGQQIRGLTHTWDRITYRPGGIFIDDLENREKVKVEELRAKVNSWFYSDCIGGRGSLHRSRVFLIGTKLHDASLLVKQVERKSIPSFTIRLCDESFNSYWPEWKTKKEIKALYKLFAEDDRTDEFYQEYLNKLIDPKTAAFKRGYFKQRYAEADLRKQVRDGTVQLETVILVDPAKTDRLEADDTAIECWSFDMQHHRFYYRDLAYGKFGADEIVEKALDMADNHFTTNIGIEYQGSSRSSIEWMFNNEATDRGKNYIFFELKPGNIQKGERIKWLPKYFKAGMIFCNENEDVVGPLEMQAIHYPRAGKRDILDCAAYMCQAFAAGEVYFTAPQEPEMDEYEAEDQALERLRLEDRVNSAEFEYTGICPIPGRALA